MSGAFHATQLRAPYINKGAVMSDLTLYPADIAAMSVSQIARLTPYQKFELDKNIFEAIDFLKVARTKLDAVPGAGTGLPNMRSQQRLR